MREDGLNIRTSKLSRRAFLIGAGTTSCAVAFVPGAGQTLADSTLRPLFAANCWVTIHSDGGIVVVCPGIELGQGAYSTLPRFVAEELDADLNDVRVVPAPSEEKIYGNPLFWGNQITAGSRTCVGYFDVLRVAGAQARYVLMTAAAQKWRVPIGELGTAGSVVRHAKSKRQATYGQLASIARVPPQFPDFIAPDDKPQAMDPLFGAPPPSPILPMSAKADAIRLKSRRQYGLIGKDGPRRDIPEKITGKARYGIDHHLPEMVYAMVETGPIPGSTPTHVDDAAARAIPGMIDVLRLPQGIAVVGADIFAVRRAREALKITWDSGVSPRCYDSDGTLEDFSRIAAVPAAHPGARVTEIGDPAVAAMALDPAKHKIMTFEVRSQLVYHAPIEPQNAVLQIAADGKSAEAWLGTQWPKLEQDYAAKILDLKAEDIRVNTLYPGGSFGRRQEPGAIVDAACIAKVLRRPVKVIWTREDDLKRNPFRQAMVCRVEAAISPDGKIAAMRHRVVADSWFARLFPDWFKQYNDSDPGNWNGALHLYDVPLQLVDSITERRGVDVCYMRGIGVSQVKFAQESLIDRIAEELGQDPLAFRVQLLRAVPRGIAVLHVVAEMCDWTRKRDGRALGLAYTPYADGHVALVAEISVDRATGALSVHEVWCAVDVGFAAQPAIVASQIEGGILQGLSIALYEQVTLKDGIVQESNFDSYPILRMSQTPEINVKVISTDNAMAGAGEIGMMQIGPAVNNALGRLTGARVQHLPMLPERVLAALKAHGSAGQATN